MLSRVSGLNAKRRGRRLAAAAALCIGVAFALAGAESAPTGIFNPIPADFSGDPQDLFVDDDYLFAYVTSDIKGGRICVVPENVSGASCDSPAWGDVNTIVGIGTVYALIEDPTLHVGRWRLMTENSIGEPTGFSNVFTVRPCLDCSRELGASVAQEFKNRFRGMQLGADALCLGWAIQDVVEGATGIVGELTAAHGKIGRLRQRADAYESGQASFVATIVGTAGSFGPTLTFPTPQTVISGPAERAKEILKALICDLDKMWDDVANDPPDPAFGDVEQPSFRPIDPLGSTDADSLARSIDRQTGFSFAILKALERYQGAVAAADQAGVHRQAMALSEFTSDLIDELRVGADALRTYATAIDALPQFQVPTIADAATRTALASVYARVRTSGFTPGEISALAAQGLTTEQIALVRTHFDLDPATFPLGVRLSSVARSTADVLLGAIPALDAMRRDAAAVAGRTNVAPVAGFTTTPQSGPAPLAVTFTDASTSPDSDPVTVAWNFGDFGTGNGPSVTHTYATNGTFVARQTVCDYLGACSSTTRVIMVGPTVPENRPPVANDDTGTVRSGGQVVVNVKANDSDPDGDSLRIAGATDPPHGEVFCSASCTYVPGADYVGPDAFEYTVSDDRGGTDTATVSIAVTPQANRAPQPVSDSLTTTAGVPKSLNVLANDTDPNGDALSVTSASDPFGGSTSCTATGICTFTPDTGFAGNTGFQYVAADGRGGTATGFVSVRVEPGAPPPNQPPVAVDDAATIVTDTEPLPFELLVNDSDPNGDAIYVSGIAGSPPGTLTCSSAGSCTFAPQAGFTGDTSFTYTVADGRGGSDTGAVSLRVIANARRPIPALTTSPASGFAPVGVSFDARGSTDPDGEIVDYEWRFGDGTTGSGAVVSHAYEEPGTYEGTLTVTDDDGLHASVPFTFLARNRAVLELPICGDEDGSEPPTPVVFRCAEYGPVQDVQLYRVVGEGDVDVTFDFIFKESGFGNEMAVIAVDDTSASIDGVQPGEDGYLGKAFARAQIVFPTGSGPSAPDKTLTFPAGTVLMFAIAQSSFAHVAQTNPENEKLKGNHVFFSLQSLNPDSSDHMMAYLRPSDGRSEFGWEDLISIGDGDFNDIVYTVDASVRPLGQIVVTKEADQATTIGGGTNGYTITVANSATGPVAVQSIEDTLPAGFSYVSGSTTGATTANPTVTGSTLTWDGPFVVPRGETLELHFDVRVAGTAGTYLNEATVDAGGFAVSGTGPTAPIEVTAAANRPPDAANDTLTTDEGVAGTVSVLANDNDPDGDTLTVTGDTDGVNGTASCTVAGSCTYTPAAGFSGADSFTYEISDGRGGLDTATVQVTVTPAIKATATTYTGAASVQYSDPAALSGTLRDTSVSPSVGVTGKQLGFTLGTQSASAGPTSAAGSASTSLVVTQQPGSVTSVATAFAGDSVHAASNDGDPFEIRKEDCTVTYAGPLTVPPLAMTTLAADLGEPDSSLGDRSGKTLTFSVTGTADPTLRTYVATTDANGRASTQAALPADVYAVSATFAGDAFYLDCETSADVLVTMAEAAAKVTGGGWISIAIGRTSFGFNAIPQADGTWRGQLQIRMRGGKDRYHAKSVSSLTVSRNTASWSGTGSWNGLPDYRYSVSVVDQGSSGGKKGDTIAVVITAPSGAIAFTTDGAQALKGGNISVHQR